MLGCEADAFRLDMGERELEAQVLADALDPFCAALRVVAVRCRRCGEAWAIPPDSVRAGHHGLAGISISRFLAGHDKHEIEITLNSEEVRPK
mgnify:CR=1 FL=1